MSKIARPLTRAGFLLSYGAMHNAAVRTAQPYRGLDLRLVRSTVRLFRTYRAMAIANGVAPDDPILAPWRDEISETRGRR
jgi:hypothetical protein